MCQAHHAGIPHGGGESTGLGAPSARLRIRNASGLWTEMRRPGRFFRPALRSRQDHGIGRRRTQAPRCRTWQGRVGAALDGGNWQVSTVKVASVMSPRAGGRQPQPRRRFFVSAITDAAGIDHEHRSAGPVDPGLRSGNCRRAVRRGIMMLPKWHPTGRSGRGICREGVLGKGSGRCPSRRSSLSAILRHDGARGGP